MRLENRLRGPGLEDLEARREGGAPPRLGRGHVQELAAADRHHRGVAPDDVPVAGQRHDRRLEPQLDVAPLPRLDGGRGHRVHARHHFARPDVEAHALARLERGRRVGEELARRVEHVRGLEEAREREHVAALDRRALDALEVHRRALAGDRGRNGLAVGLDAAHLRLEPMGIHLHPLVQGELAGRHRPGHHRAEPPDREDAVDRQPEGGVGPARGHGPRERGERLTQRRQALPGLRGDRQDRRAVEERPPQEAPDVLPDQLQPVGFGQIRLGEHDDAAPHPEQLADREVLARLRHHPLVRRDDQHDEVDAADPGQHVLHEPLVPGHVDDAEGQAVAEVEVGEADVDGDAALFLLLEAVGVDPGQREDQARFAVVDVARRAGDDVTHGVALTPAPSGRRPAAGPRRP